MLAMGPATTGASAYYVVGAHYDTVPGTPGADDNASAVAVMLELSRRVQQHRLKAPGLFAAFTLEEPPAHLTSHQGSRTFVRQCQSQGDRVLGAIVLEMVGYSAPRRNYPFLSRWPGCPARGNFVGISETGAHGASDRRFEEAFARTVICRSRRCSSPSMDTSCPKPA